MRARIAALLLVACQGCSLVLVAAPADHLPREEPPSCTRAGTLPIFESYASLVAAAVGLGIGVRTLLTDRDGTQLAIAGGLIGAGVVLKISAGVGLGRVGRCNKAVRRHERWRQGLDADELNPRDP